MTWSAFSRDPFQVSDRQIWPVFVDSLTQRQIKNQNTDTVWKTSKARLKHPPCIKTFLYKNNHKVANSYFPTWWDQLQPGISLEMCGADCGTAFRESIKLKAESWSEKNKTLWTGQLNRTVGGTWGRNPSCTSTAYGTCPTLTDGNKAGHSPTKHPSFNWVWYTQYLTHKHKLSTLHTYCTGSDVTEATAAV